MHRLGMLGAFLPEFGALLCMPQYDAYHIYTVDQHSLMGVRELERLRDGFYKATAPLLTEVIRDIDKIELLFLAMLLHDAGKGQGGGHSEKGAGLVPEVAARLRLNDDETQQLEFLVRHHLTMIHLAQRRDVRDMKLVAEFVKLVGNVNNLKKLYLLTFADMKAVGPKAWSSWQDMLLAELYKNALEVFEKGAFTEPDRAERIRLRVAENVRATGAQGPSRERVELFLRDMPDRYFVETPEEEIPRHIRLVGNLREVPMVTAVRHFPEREFSDLTVVTTDQPGLFSRITGVLTAHGMNIVGARINTSQSHVALDVFRVSHLDRAETAQDPERWERIQVTLNRVVAGEVDVEQLVASKRTSMLAKKFVPRVGIDVQVDNKVSDHYTVLDVYAQDRVGLLFTITNCLFHLGLSIHVAKITTNVDQVLDVFYVSENGHKIGDERRLAEIREQVLGWIKDKGRVDEDPDGK
jgi:[protein-PII] uridylyltransferase